MSNRNLNKAREAKNDEFYTRLTDIEKEMSHYQRHFKGKVVFCPCDDPYASQFFQYFSKQFERLGLKKLITACYQNVDPLRMSKHDIDGAIWLEYTGAKKGRRVPKPEDLGIHYFEGDGDFRSEESLALLRESDIVVTNPPFSLFRDFMDILQSERKKFIVVGNFNSVRNKDFWPFVRGGLLWLGVSPRGMVFDTPIGEKSGNACWFTNLDHKKRHEEIVCYRRFDSSEYPKYDYHNAIEVSKTKDIPCDYDGVMGVPISFLDKYNPDQFEILGMTNTGEKNEGIRYPNTPHGRAMVNGKEIYGRILIRHRKKTRKTG
ncbi:MAG: modification methylase [Ectothiorhodospiraceae bacterium AqS1]|nr:modification methylase [Ectothiorhodospiraceae bacterium AqS1]